jgi:WD40 repeat protein
MRKALFLSGLMLCVIFLPIISAVDGDGDGVDDSIDICPFAAGTANSTAGLGCPDSNGDGLADFEQTVIHDWGESIRENTDTNAISSQVYAVGWATNNSIFYAGGRSDELNSFDSMGNHLAMMYTMPGDIYDLAVSPDGQHVAVVSANGGCVVVNATTGGLVADLWNNSSNSGVYEIAWTNDGSKIIAGGNDNIVKWFHASNWTLERNITSLPDRISGVDTTPDDRLILFSTGSSVRGYWSNNGTLALNMSNHTQYIRTLVVSPDGRYMATGSDDNTIKITDLLNQTIVISIDASSDVYSLDFSPDGGTLVAARGSQASMYAYRTDSWTSIGEMEGFGSSNNNRGVYSVEFDADGDKLAVGWRRGYVSIQMSPDSYIRVHGEHNTALMESSWRSSYPTLEESVRTWDRDRVTTTIDLCDSKHYIGSNSNGVSQQYATKDSNYSTNGLWHCKYTNEEILEIPYGRSAGALMVKSGGNTETCVQLLGGLTMAQVRWISSSQNKNTLTTDAEMPGLVWSSVVPNDNGNGIPEWIDLDSSCPDTEIVLSHRWENKTDTTILEETVLCSNCATTDSIYASTASRYRAIAGEFRSDVTQGVAASGGEGSIGFTELVFTLNNGNGVYIVPLVDNFTHGAVDAIADGGVAVNASVNASRSGDWPLQTDMRAFVATSHLAGNINFMKFLLGDIGQLKWEQMGFVGLSPWALYNSWAKLGVDMSYLLPDADQDGVWDGGDNCPETELGLDTDLNGCAENQLDDDDDGYTNDLDDCDDVAGTSTIVLTGCPDSDGDGWPDVEDSHPSDSSEWNDTDMDGFGDNTDDCVDVFGNSTNDLVGCEDLDGDGWSDAGDQFPDDSTEWADTDGDGFGDNTDVFPYENTQWLDTDGDGFGDNNTGLEGDDCIDVSGTSHEDGLFGCIDSDSDGWADTIDDLPSNPEQHRDEDGDGVGDSASIGDYDWCTETPQEEIAMVDAKGCGPSERDGDYDTFSDDVDQCPNTPISKSTLVNTTLFLDSQGTIPNPIVGCAPSEVDADGDSVTSDLDWDDNDPDQWSDTDGDGFGDNSGVEGGDDCPTSKGYSVYDKTGCVDLDGDGWSYETDFNDGDSTQWNDSDGDGFGDNWDNPEWNDTRTHGQFLVGATQPDRCPDVYSAFLYSETQGCLSSLETNDDTSDDVSSEEEDDSNIMLILGIAAAGIVLILFGAIAVLIKKKPTPKRRPVDRKESTEEVVLKELEDSDPVVESLVDFVATWEELPPGEWLPSDENGVNWYKDEDGRHWYSDSEGYRVWDQ